MTTKSLIALLIGLMLVLGLVQAQHSGVSAEASSGTVIDIVMRHAHLTTFAQALSASQLSHTLVQPGPFTLFIPSNDAFAKLPQEQLEALLASP